MQARLEFRRFPVSFLAFALALAVALLLGLGVGYGLKGTTATTGPARVVVLGPQSSPWGDDNCIWVNHHKEC